MKSINTGGWGRVGEGSKKTGFHQALGALIKAGEAPLLTF